MEETLKSLDSQTFEDFEILLIDDGSSEEASKKALQELKTQMKDFQRSQKVLRILDHEKNMGLAFARNTGVQYGNHYPYHEKPIHSSYL